MFGSHLMGVDMQVTEHSLPHDEENHQGHDEVIGLVVQQVADHPVVPFCQISELGLGETVRSGEEIVPLSERSELHLGRHESNKHGHAVLRNV